MVNGLASPRLVVGFRGAFLIGTASEDVAVHSHDGRVADFRKLSVWGDAQTLTKEVYRVTARFPDRERYGLTAQMRRAACSISANIAEGCGRLGDRELNRFLLIAAGSAAELESHILQAGRLGFIQKEELDRLVTSTVLIRKRIYRLRNYLLRQDADPTP